MPVVRNYPGVRTKWYGPELTKKVVAGTSKNRRKAAKFLLRKVQLSIAHQGHPGYHSKPYDPPFRQSGKLIASYDVEYAPGVAVVGSDDPNARWQELGTSRQAPRPHLLRNLYGNADAIARLMCAPL